MLFCFYADKCLIYNVLLVYFNNKVAFYSATKLQKIPIPAKLFFPAPSKQIISYHYRLNHIGIHIPLEAVAGYYGEVQ